MCQTQASDYLCKACELRIFLHLLMAEKNRKIILVTGENYINPNYNVFK